MPDMLVKLYNVFPEPEMEEALRADGITFKRVMPPDLTNVVTFVKEKFSQGWADECTVGIMKNHCWIAVCEKKVIGFACYDTTMPDYFGPTGVDPDYRGKGIGRVLLVKSLLSLKEMGYAYAIIGFAGPVDFYSKVVGATVIPDSTPRSYHNLIKLDSAYADNINP